MLSSKTLNLFHESVEKIRNLRLHIEDENILMIDAIKLKKISFSRTIAKFRNPTKELRASTIADLKEANCENIIFALSFPLESYLDNILGKIIIRCIEENDSDIFERLISLATSKFESIEFLEITPIWGIKTKEPIIINDRIRLVPINDLPDSKQKDELLNFQNNDFFFGNIILSRPETAIVAKQKITRQDIKEQYKNIDYFTDKISTALVAFFPCAIWEYSRWIQFDNPDFDTLSMKADKAKPIIDILPKFTFSKEITQNEYALIIDFLNKYLNLDEKVRDKINIALVRLNNSLKRTNEGDRALELSIAFEVLLSEESTSEISYKVRVRGSRLIGGDINQRLKNFDILSNIYSIRSQMVHKGSVKAGKQYNIFGLGKINAHEVCTESTVLCANLINIIIDYRSFPKWREFDIN